MQQRNGQWSKVCARRTVENKGEPLDIPVKQWANVLVLGNRPVDSWSLQWRVAQADKSCQSNRWLKGH